MEHFKLNLESDFKFDDIVVALGNFDGFHRGHQKLISELNNVKLEKGYKSAVFLFENHTKDLIFHQNASRIMSFEDKLNKLESFKIDYVFSIEFSERIKNLSPKEFLDFLTINLNIKHIVVGEDYKFSKNREGNTDFIRSYMKEKCLSCTIIDKLRYNNIEISSTKIIEYIKSGKIELANDLLGYNFSIKGKVTQGFQRGRNLGYPTANLEISFNYVMVKEGVYFTKTIVDKNEYFSFSSVGHNPTFDNKKSTIESHIFDFHEDIYRKDIELCFLKRLRDNIKFNSVEELIEQLKKDEIRCRELIKNIK